VRTVYADVSECFCVWRSVRKRGDKSAVKDQPTQYRTSAHTAHVEFGKEVRERGRRRVEGRDRDKNEEADFAHH
jgi:hypothetical protein